MAFYPKGNEFSHPRVDGQHRGWHASVTNVLVESNYIHDTDALGINLFNGASKCTIRGNLLERISEKADGTYYYGNAASAMYVDGGNISLFERNVVRQSGWGINVLAEPGNLPGHDIIVRDNEFYDNGTGAINVGNWYSTTDKSVAYNISVTNNTCYNNGVGFSVRPYSSASVVIENNIFSQNTFNLYNALSWPVGTMDYNLYYGRGAGPDVHRVTANPQCTNPGANPPDFSLQPSSPAINAGNPAFVLGSGETDFLGNARVVDGRVDIGAYEFQ